MALRYLGVELDVHGGGTDLIYPHHEHEAAQSESATGHNPFSRFWVHVEMVLLGGIKMSKSLGNLVLVRDLTPTFDPRAIRHYLLETHYRSELDYSEESLRVPPRRSGRSTARSPCRRRRCPRARGVRSPTPSTPRSPTTSTRPERWRALSEATRLVLRTAAAPLSGAAATVPNAQAELRAMASRLGLAPR